MTPADATEFHFVWLCIEQVGRETSFDHAQKNEISKQPIRKGDSQLAAYFKGGSKAGNL